MQNNNNNKTLQKISSQILKSTKSLVQSTNNLVKSTHSLGRQLQNIFAKKKIDPETLQTLRDTLIQNDFGPKLTFQIITQIEKNIQNNNEQAKDILQKILVQKLEKNLAEIPLPQKNQKKPHVIIVMGVNGSGKTTTIGKIANFYQNKKYKILIAAADTFRAAAIEQLTIIAKKAGVQIYKKNPGFEPAALAFNAWKSANENNFDILIIDTAGRLQNKQHLMDELQKIARVINKLDHNAPHDKILVVDATTGQNMISQVEIFNQTIKQLTGIIMTKMDSSSKGGILFGVCDKFDTKIIALGYGENINDITKLNPQQFVDNILQNNER